MTNLAHLDLFSGLGGFALAARWCGVTTTQFVEIDARCRAFLAKAHPGVPIHDDIKTYHYDNPTRPWLLTGGVPCQPASRAGKQRGKEDDRWLWPEALRVISEARPAWCLLENPPGIGDVGLSGILAGVEGAGYAVRVFSIPACAVGSPQRRERYWIVAHAQSDNIEHDSEPNSNWESGIRGTKSDRIRSVQVGADVGDDGKGGVADARSVGRDTRRGSESAGCEGAGACAEADGLLWSRSIWLPCADGKFRRAPDDTVGMVDGLHRSLLGALGNSIVPQVAARIIQAMIDADRSP